MLRNPANGIPFLERGFDISGIDLSTEMLAKLNEKAPNAKVFQKDILKYDSTEKYDYIFVDCPPSLGLITINALTGSDTLLVPIQCEYYALEGLSQLMATVRQVKRLYNQTLDIEGVLLTMYQGRLNLTLQVVDEVKKFFPQKVYKTVIPRNVRISEAPSFGQPILYYDKGSKGTKAYDELAKELLKKNKQR